MQAEFLKPLVQVYAIMNCSSLYLRVYLCSGGPVYLCVYLNCHKPAHLCSYLICFSPVSSCFLYIYGFKWYAVHLCNCLFIWLLRLFIYTTICSIVHLFTYAIIIWFFAGLLVHFSYISYSLNPLETKRRLLYLKTQFVPRSKHFSSRF
jgi:hypothetical protein